MKFMESRSAAFERNDLDPEKMRKILEGLQTTHIGMKARR